jgi:hypothetical protein
MNKYCYSASMNAFYPFAMRLDYETAGSWPDDALVVSDEVAFDFMAEPPEKQIRVAGEDGLPQWKNKPKPTHEERVFVAAYEKQERIKQANELINSRQWPGKAALSRLKDNELAQYVLWLDYLDRVSAIDVNAAPEISWPRVPDSNV